MRSQILSIVIVLFVSAGPGSSQEISQLVAGTVDYGHLGESVDLAMMPPPIYGAALIGAPGDHLSPAFTGEAYLCMPVNGDWSVTTTTVLTASDGVLGAEFGKAVALDGLTAVVGAPWRDTPGAYIYVNGSTERIITPPFSVSQFGRSVAIDGSTIAVGAEGVAFLFNDTSNGDWSSYSVNAFSPPAGVQNFGVSIDYEDSTLVVGADEAIFIYQGLTSVEIQSFDHDDLVTQGFGYSISLDGSTIAVGAPYDTAYTGAAYVIQDTSAGGDWSSVRQVRLFRGDLAEWDHFGISVSIEGSVLTVGATRKNADDDTIEQTGGIYVFKDLSTTGDWSVYTGTLFQITDAQDDDRLGISVALADGMVVGGAYYRNSNSVFQSGAAYMFDTSMFIFNADFETGNTGQWTQSVP